MNITKILLVLYIFTLIFSFIECTTPREAAKITSLPGLTFTPNFEQYSGYITLQGTNKNIFYWFVTSQNSPSTDPLVLWMNGGPGCSDLGDGLFQENGPFVPIVYGDSTTVNLTSNYYSWNKVANVIYIESPCGVGFSYSDQPNDYTSNDNITAYDNYLFLTGFFEIYPEFSSNTFWICGESYAGIYITTLAYEILTTGASTSISSNLKKGGLMLGNPITNCYGTNGVSYESKDIIDMNAQINLYYWHAMISRRDYDNWNNNLCNTTFPPSLSTCSNIFTSVQTSIGVLVQPTLAMASDSQRKKRQDDAAINPDMLYFSYCTGNGTLDFNTAQSPNCYNLDDQISAYLNDLTVQEAIHAQPPKTPWKECGGVLYNKTMGSVIPILEYFFSNAPSMRVLYYAGDIDIATVPFAPTQICLETLNRPIKEKWRPYVINKEVVGYVEVYDTYTFAMVKGSGHESPQFQPAANYLLFTSFLNNERLP